MLTFQLVTGEDGSLSVASTEPASLHEQVQLTGRQLTLAEGVQLNLIGIGKAWAVDRGADAAAQACGAPVLLNIGGDIATAGPTRPWTVTVQDLENDPASTIELINGGAIATSSTQKRRWARDGQGWHHIINPATGLSATPDLATASVIAGSATEANTYSTAAIARSTGATALILLSVSLALGILARSGKTYIGIPRFATTSIHRTASLLALIFTLIHIITLYLDTYTGIALTQFFIPFTTASETLAYGLGTQAFDLILALAVTGLLRHRLPEKLFHLVHWGAYACWPAALTLHTQPTT